MKIKKKQKKSNRNNFKKQNDTNTKVRELDTLNSTKFESIRIINPINERLFNINNEYLCLYKNKESSDEQLEKGIKN